MMSQAASKIDPTPSPHGPTPSPGIAIQFPKFEWPKFEWPKFEATDEVHYFYELMATNAAKAATQFNAKIAEAAIVNTQRAFDLAHDVAAAKSLPELTDVYTSYTGKQCVALAQQIQELSALGQMRIADTVASVTSIVPRIAKATASS